MAVQEDCSWSSLTQAVMDLPSLLRELYYSDDFQTRVCWWFLYTLLVLLILIHISWKLYGKEISKAFMLQGGQYTPARQRSQDGVSSNRQHVKVD